MPGLDSELRSEPVREAAEAGSSHGRYVFVRVDVAQRAFAVTVHPRAERGGWRERRQNVGAVNADDSDRRIGDGRGGAALPPRRASAEQRQKYGDP